MGNRIYHLRYLHVGGYLAYCLSVDLNSPPQLAADNCGENSYQSCLETPFNLAECSRADLDNARALACIKNSNSDTSVQNRCPGLIARYCSDTTANRGLNPFHDSCDGNRASDTVRQNACRGDLEVSYKCPDVVTLTCTGQQGGHTITANPFHKLCFADDIYQTARETDVDTCDDDGTDPSAANCANAKPSICAGTGEFSNPFVDLCVGVGNLAELKHIKCLATEAADGFHNDCGDILENANVISNVWQYGLCWMITTHLIIAVMIRD